MTTVYVTGVHATGSDGKVYVSKASGKVGHDPVSDAAAYWQPFW